MVESPILKKQGQHRMGESSPLVPVGELGGSQCKVLGLFTVPARVPVEGEELGFTSSIQLRGDQQGVLALASSRHQAQKTTMEDIEPAANGAGHVAGGLKHSYSATDQSYQSWKHKHELVSLNDDELDVVPDTRPLQEGGSMTIHHAGGIVGLWVGSIGTVVGRSHSGDYPAWCSWSESGRSGDGEH